VNNNIIAALMCIFIVSFIVSGVMIVSSMIIFIVTRFYHENKFSFIDNIAKGQHDFERGLEKGRSVARMGMKLHKYSYLPLSIVAISLMFIWIFNM